MSSTKPVVVSLVVGGEARFVTEVAPAADAESLHPAVSELIRHLQACLGRPVSWFDRRTHRPELARLVLKLDVLSGLAAEAFRIDAEPGAVTLCASTVSGLEHAVHYFLEQAFGVRWLWPGALGTVTPAAKEVRWPVGSQTHAPSFAWRRLWIGGSWWEESDAYLGEQKHGGVSVDSLEALFRWHRRLRLGGLNIADGHRWGEICSPLRYGESHPEYFAMVGGVRDTQWHDGKHGNQPCTSNPDVVRVVADYIKAQFRARPELDAFSIACNDGSGFCECAPCQAIDDWAESAEHKDHEFDALTAEGPNLGKDKKRVLTDRMVLFANQIAERVGEEFPDKLLLMLIYSFYRTPPKRVSLHGKAIAQFCSMTFSHTDAKVFDAEMRSFERLSKNAKHLGIYDYYVNGKNGTLPRGFARTASRSIRKYHALGARYFSTQAGLDFAIGGFVYYYTARLLWDIRADVDDVLHDYCRAGFGAGAEAVAKYLQAFMDRWETLWPALPSPKPSMEALAGVLYPSEWRGERRNELDEALKLAGDDAAAAGRVRFLIEGLDFLDLLIDACDAANAAFAHLDAPAAAIARAACTRKALIEWVDAHRDGFWISAAWFDYQRLTRSGLLGQPLPSEARCG